MVAIRIKNPCHKTARIFLKDFLENLKANGGQFIPWRLFHAEVVATLVL
jgi:hypothetical protein